MRPRARRGGLNIVVAIRASTTAFKVELNAIPQSRLMALSGGRHAALSRQQLGGGLDRTFAECSGVIAISRTGRFAWFEHGGTTIPPS